VDNTKKEGYKINKIIKIKKKLSIYQEEGKDEDFII
jgi:hypothetical protein